MALTAIVLPVAALIAVGGPSALVEGVRTLDVPGFASLTAGDVGWPALLGVLALLGISIGYPGQPHVVNRFMALRDDDSIVRARRYAISWGVIVYAGMITLGLCGRVLHAEPLGDEEQTFFALADELFPPVISGIILAAVLSAIMSTADSQLLVAASAVSHDLGFRGKTEKAQLLRSRAVVLAVSIVAVGLALWGSQEIFSSVLFAWSALGSTFGPLLLVTLWRGPVGPTRSLLAMFTGFTLSVVAYSIPDTSGTVAERIVPFLAATAILLTQRRPS
jgi:sodium/proline symporter